MNLKKRALHLAVAAGMVGSLVAVAAPAAHAVTVLDPTCAVYIQGPIDPLGGVLPNAIPLNQVNTHIYYAVGHDIKGQDKTIADVNNTALGATRFSYGVTMTNLVDNSVVALKYAWKNDKTLPVVPFPTVSVKTTVQVAKGTLTGVGGADNFGAVIGNVTQSPVVYRLVVPKGATSGGYNIAFTIPANALAPGTPPVDIPVSIPFAYNASAAVIQGTINAALAPLSSGATVTGTNFNPGVANGDYNIAITGALSAAAPIFTIPDTQTGTLATTQLDDGTIQNGTRFGGVNPAISPVGILPQGIVSVNGMMNSGPVTLPKGKTSWANDTQVTALGFKVQLVTSVAPRLGTTDPGILGTTGALAGLVGAPLAAVNDPCGLGGLLALFCTAESALIPAAFAGLCPSILGP